MTYIGDEDRILMVVLLGKVDQFDPELEEWPHYVEWLEEFFEANGIIGEAIVDKKHSTFLAVIGLCCTSCYEAYFYQSHPRQSLSKS